jgi:hypothetical protein
LKDTGLNKERRERGSKKERKNFKDTETPIMTLSVLLERYQHDESNNTKESHKQ